MCAYCGTPPGDVVQAKNHGIAAILSQDECMCVDASDCDNKPYDKFHLDPMDNLSFYKQQFFFSFSLYSFHRSTVPPFHHSIFAFSAIGNHACCRLLGCLCSALEGLLQPSRSDLLAVDGREGDASDPTLA